MPWGWRLSLGLAAVPAMLLLLGGLVLPESPNSLIERWAVGKGGGGRDHVAVVHLHCCTLSFPLALSAVLLRYSC